MDQKPRKRPASLSQPELAAAPVEEHEIAQAAYQRYEARGREDGHDVDDWLEAEREIREHRMSGRDTRGDEGLNGSSSGQAA